MKLIDHLPVTVHVTDTEEADGSLCVPADLYESTAISQLPSITSPESWSPVNIYRKDHEKILL